MRKVFYLIRVSFVLLLLSTNIYTFHPYLNSPQRLFDGNWSFTADHNVKRILPESGPSRGVPYDFDFAGIVNTHYAVPIRIAKAASTKDRFYRGYCQSPEVFAQIFAHFQKHKQEIFSLYKNFPLISKKYKKRYLNSWKSFIRLSIPLV
ncbi:MAG: hypothetical protein GTO45_16790 [Candidatus Aminicenantes bacterium]|nr:hypothetical protein [Candidatus Aminicenantes bacterium]NIM80399.1 hypothetical protein [Candidatus Aminicenantes bacterium]NIN19786.1 hypothetical protein [Candidatus Aminicenantes bacterium]NIN43668.1 hypothetical protein [Candidatus Aminicenantes bacterium]NIN86413.1 hypothetical protein [Candidatus Aminicenantes bacterium]